MSEGDDWERRHRAQPPRGEPSPFVVTALEAVAARFPGGLALDLAAGAGRHTAAMRTLGLRPIALDRARAAAGRIAREIPGAASVVGDAGALPFAGPTFAAIVQTCFLERRAFPALAELLLPGGLLVVETFLAAQHERTGHPRRERCLEPGEGEAICRALGLEVAALRTSRLDGPPPYLAAVAARRPIVFSC